MKRIVKKISQTFDISSSTPPETREHGRDTSGRGRTGGPSRAPAGSPRAPAEPPQSGPLRGLRRSASFNNLMNMNLSLPTLSGAKQRRSIDRSSIRVYHEGKLIHIRDSSDNPSSASRPGIESGAPLGTEGQSPPPRSRRSEDSRHSDLNLLINKELPEPPRPSGHARTRTAPPSLALTAAAVAKFGMDNASQLRRQRRIRRDGRNPDDSLGSRQGEEIKELEANQEKRDADALHDDEKNSWLSDNSSQPEEVEAYEGEVDNTDRGRRRQHERYHHDSNREPGPKSEPVLKRERKRPPQEPIIFVPPKPQLRKKHNEVARPIQLSLQPQTIPSKDSYQPLSKAQSPSRALSALTLSDDQSGDAACGPARPRMPASSSRYDSSSSEYSDSDSECSYGDLLSREERQPFIYGSPASSSNMSSYRYPTPAPRPNTAPEAKTHAGPVYAKGRERLLANIQGQDAAKVSPSMDQEPEPRYTTAKARAQQDSYIARALAARTKTPPPMDDHRPRSSPSRSSASKAPARGPGSGYTTITTFPTPEGFMQRVKVSTPHAMDSQSAWVQSGVFEELPRQSALFRDIDESLGISAVPPVPDVNLRNSGEVSRNRRMRRF